MEKDKIILIDRSHFEINPSNRTKKKTANKTNVDIQYRQPIKPKEKNTTSRKNTLLKFIRKHQEKNRKHLLEDDDHEHKEDQPTEEDVNETLDYLMQIANKVHQEKNNHIMTDENVEVNYPTNPISMPISSVPVKTNYPQYGCLKNGNLPTYSQYVHNKATYVEEPIHPLSRNIMDKPETSIQIDNSSNYEEISNPRDIFYDDDNVKLKYLKQKKTKHRTFRVGKSKNIRKIGVLVSNRTIRKNITTKSQLLKQTPIHEIKKFLIKKGLIKVGTTAPNEVLRKMYETSQMICGDLHNHNTDIILHNYIHDDTKF